MSYIKEKEIRSYYDISDYIEKNIKLFTGKTRRHKRKYPILPDALSLSRSKRYEEGGIFELETEDEEENFPYSLSMMEEYRI